MFLFLFFQINRNAKHAARAAELEELRKEIIANGKNIHPSLLKRPPPPPARLHTHKLTHTRTRTHTRTCTRTHIYTFTHSHVLAHTQRVGVTIPTHTHTYTHTLTHTVTQSHIVHPKPQSHPPAGITSSRGRRPDLTVNWSPTSLPG